MATVWKNDRHLLRTSDWFRPLFQQLDERGLPWLKIDARHHNYDVSSPEREYSLLFNRMSPSHAAGLGHSIFYTLNYLAHLEGNGVRVVMATGASIMKFRKRCN